ncbi:Hpt domain-containing protein [Rhodanobacter sp. MP7CTX1]|uniref:Hpt domain-containing protein n=1 Tax=Rhodanobacter sp. MP7CTX1 TaxID=2723084 RepID=UPI001609AC4E|nr:Hpt domain-containing protein [Rhodanobacter sp. MP7CTX1]MBB6188001.1 HPt (histidine-containing phosphotransfer) domain-containing protein [Rhodanobacter sp. MP7CTX1]
MKVIQRALIDLQEIGGDAFVGECIELFLSSAPTKLTDAKDAAEKGDVKTAIRAAHTLKSTAAQLGLEKLSALCSEMEMLGNAGDMAGLLRLLADAENELVWAERAISRVFAVNF